MYKGNYSSRNKNRKESSFFSVFILNKEKSRQGSYRDFEGSINN